MGQVRIGTCSDAIDSAFIRSMFEARGIRCVIGGERHAALLGPIHGAFLSLDIWVDAEDAEAATELLREVRDTKPDDAPDPRAGMEPGELDDLEDDGEWAARAHDRLAQDDQASRALAKSERAELEAMRDKVFYRRRARLGVLASFATLGVGHLITGAPLRGLVLGAIAVLGYMHRASGDPLGTVAVVAAAATDLLGTVWRMRKKGYL